MKQIHGEYELPDVFPCYLVMHLKKSGVDLYTSLKTHDILEWAKSGENYNQLNEQIYVYTMDKPRKIEWQTLLNIVTL